MESARQSFAGPSQPAAPQLQSGKCGDVATCRDEDQSSSASVLVALHLDRQVAETPANRHLGSEKAAGRPLSAR